MIRLFHKADNQTPLVERPFADLEDTRMAEGWIWIDHIDPTDEELHQLGDAFGIDPLTLDEVRNDTIFPKVDDWDSYLFVVLHGSSRRGDKLTTSELDFILGEDFLITIHRGPSPAVDFVVDNSLRTAPFGRGGPDQMFSRIAETQGQRYLPLIDSLDEQIEELEERSIKSDPAVIPDVQALRRDAVILRRVIGPQREVLLSLGGEISTLIGERARRRFRGLYDHHYRLVESLDASRGLLASILDTYRSAVAERMNEVMKVLTVYTAIVLPLSLMAGLYGMNFTNIPELQWRWGYFALLAIMGALALGQWIYFSRRGFIGGPSLRKMTGVVGKGLVLVTLAPVRSVGHLLDRTTGDRSEPPEF
ncbi:MAG: magnesium/cobalt transporter CorA [Acidimicrobiia bacterium]|nr:magnesium/cobalt transporter CorA [Acidimicrobiia bacterium]